MHSCVAFDEGCFSCNILFDNNDMHEYEEVIIRVRFFYTLIIFSFRPWYLKKIVCSRHEFSPMISGVITFVLYSGILFAVLEN